MAYRNDTAWNTFEMLVNSGNDTLESILLNGQIPNSGELAGHEYNGYSTWWITKPLGMEKFTKGFLKLDIKDETRFGVYNIQTHSNEFGKRWVHKRDKTGQRIHFGYGDVYAAKEDLFDNLYSNSLLINYGLNPSNSKHPVRNFRDYLVCADGDDSSVIIGKSFTVFGPEGIVPIKFMNLPELGSYVANGALRSLPNYFVLIRQGKSDKNFEKFFSNYPQTTRIKK